MPGANMRPITPASVVLVLSVLSVGSPFALSFMLASFVCLLHWRSLCWCSSCRRLSCVGAVCRAGMFVVLACLSCWCVCCAGACHALHWCSGVVFIWYLSWVWVCRAGV